MRVLEANCKKVRESLKQRARRAARSIGYTVYALVLAGWSVRLVAPAMKIQCGEGSAVHVRTDKLWYNLVTFLDG